MIIKQAICQYKNQSYKLFNGKFIKQNISAIIVIKRKYCFYQQKKMNLIRATKIVSL